LRASELTGMKLASYHNMHFFNEQARLVRKNIKNGKL
jgi:tRNA-guanine family transglycosylase